MGSKTRAAQSLLDTCCNAHDACAKDRGDNANRLPLLLIDIGRAASDTVRLVHRDEAQDAVGPANVRWATFSYPRDSNTPRLGTKEEITNHKTCIDLETLPKAYQEAVEIARYLGLRYLWIDKFCAWEEEDGECKPGASRWSLNCMDNIADIFEYAELNIAVAVSPGPVDSGYVGSDRMNTHGARSTRYSPDGLPMIKSLSHFVQPLLSDPWAFQERLLSRRKIYYLDTGDFIWSCRHFPHICSHSMFGKVWADCIMATPKKWSEVLEAFSRCDVDDDHDQMEATKGLIQRKEAKLRVQRLWNAQIGHIPQDLIWLGDVTYQREEDVRRFWSCSWASWFGPKMFLNNRRATTLAKDFESEGATPGGLRIRCARFDGPRVELLSVASWDPAAEALFVALPCGTLVAAAWDKGDWQFSRPCYIYDGDGDGDGDGDSDVEEGTRRRRLLGRGIIDNADHFDQYCFDRPTPLSLALLVDEVVVLPGGGGNDGDDAAADAHLLPWATTTATPTPPSSSPRGGDGGERLLRVHYGLILLASGPDEYERVGVFECYGEAPANTATQRFLLT